MSISDHSAVNSALPAFCLSVEGMTCEHCRTRVEQAALGTDGVKETRVDLEAGTLHVQGGDPQAVIRALAEAGYPAKEGGTCRPHSSALPMYQETVPVRSSADVQSYLLRIDDMHCASCVSRVEQAVLAVPGVRKAAVNLIEKSAAIEGGDPEEVIKVLVQAGYPASLVEEPKLTPEEGYEIDILGMHCASCVSRVEQALLAVPGVSDVSVNLIEKKALIHGGQPDQAIQAVVDQGYGASLRMRSASDSFVIELHTEPESGNLEQIREILLAQDPGADMTVDGQLLRITTSQHPADTLLRIADIGLEASLEETYVDPSLRQAEETRQEIRLAWRRAILAGVVGTAVMVGHMSGFFPHPENGQLFWAGAALLCLLTMMYSGRNYFIGAWKQAKHGAANMDTLVALGTGAAWISSLVVIVDPTFIPGAGDNLFLDASVMILAFLQLGRALETRAKRTTSEAIGALIGLRPRTALVVRAAGQVEIPVSLLRLGDRLRVKPGEKVPIDGEIIEGQTTIDESMLTGEPLAVLRAVGDTVTGGTINRSGSFILQVTRLGEDTTLARIIRMVKTAQMSKPPIGRLVDRIAGIFVPIVIAISLITLLAWSALATELPLAHGITAAIAVLVIACPCALGLATPIAIMVGTSRAAQSNVLIRNSDALQTAATLTHVVVDKTGTLTEGRPAVTSIYPAAGYTEREVLHWAASLEVGSEHPLAEAVLTAQSEHGGALTPVNGFKAVTGRGVSAEYNDVTYLLGNHKFFEDEGVVLPPELLAEAGREADLGGTPVWLGKGVDAMGLLILKDPLRQDSVAAVKRMQSMGIEVVMCSGDNRATAEAVAREVGITRVHSEILPEEKLQVIRALQEKGGKVGMVGDGVNDAPALAQADTGFAIGSGTDVAIENADITLSGDSLLLVADAITISGATIRNIRQNLFGAFVYNVIGIPLAAGVFYPLTGWLLNPMFASLAMALSSVTVVTNANRLRFFQPRGEGRVTG